MSTAFYVASVLGAVAVFMMMPRQRYSPTRLGALLGAMTLGALWLYLSRHLPAMLGLENAAFSYYYIFSGLAIASAAKVITHTKPVFSALWFVMVILAVSGLFLLLEAQFTAFALVIIYGGAILVTYLFVIMLASQAGDPQDEASGPDYDRVAFEPVAAVAAGFLLLAVLLTAAFEQGPRGLPKPTTPGQDLALAKTILKDRPAQRLAERITPEEASMLAAVTPDMHQISNTERVGLDLFREHPLGLELAGVILLVSLIGAVVIARRQVDPGGAGPGPGDDPSAGSPSLSSHTTHA